MDAMPIVSLFGGIIQGVMGSGAAQASGQAQASAMQYNAMVAQQNAAAAANAASANAKQQQMIGNENKAHMLASMAANGYDISQGSPTMLLDKETAQNSLAIQNTIYQGQIQSANFTNQAAMDSRNASNALQAGNYQGTGSLLSGVMGGVGSAARLYGQQTMLTSKYDQMGSV